MNNANTEPASQTINNLVNNDHQALEDINKEAAQTSKVTGKLGITLLLLILILPFLGVSYLLNDELNNESRFITRQKAGSDYLVALRTLLEHVQQHRDISYASLQGAREFEPKLAGLTERINEDLREIEKLDTVFESIAQSDGTWLTWRRDWLSLQQQHLQMSPTDNFNAHTVQIDQILSSIHKASDVFHLSLDTQLESRALTEAVIRMPKKLESLAQVRALGTGMVAREHISANEKVRLRALGQSINEGLDDLIRSINVLFQRSPDLQAHLSGDFDKAVSSISHFLQDTVYKQITNSAALQISTSGYFNTSSAALSDLYRLFDSIDNELNTLLIKRLENTQHKRTLLQASILLILVVAIAIYFVFLHHQAVGRRLWLKLQHTAKDLEDKAEALSCSNQELDQFAYIASHDLKAPLRAIANLSQWVEEDLEEVMTDDTRKQMALLRGRVARMEALINGVLQYSRAGRMDMEMESVDVAQLLAEVLDGLAPPPGFRIDIAPDMPILQTARVPLSQVFGNLLSNAIKYHDRPESAQVKVSMQQLNGAMYEFSVADDGPGIASEFHDKVFQIFQTLNARDKVESTGVGLTVVQKIVEELGGEISLESEEGHGSIFRFTVPKLSNDGGETKTQAGSPDREET